MTTSAVVAKFAASVDEAGPLPRWAPFLGPCHIWTGTLNHSGYGRLSVSGMDMLAHRWAYEHSNGPVPDGLVLDHLCRVRHCVNLAHLEMTTHRVNILRGMTPSAVAVRTGTCQQGHEYTAASTYVNPRGQRQCRICAAAYKRARRAAA